MKTIFDKYPPEQLKQIQSILQQNASLITAHHKATQALATFERDVANNELCFMQPDRERETRDHLTQSIRLIERGLASVLG